jgi:drug/metabolite transporter (DMT)-like permease
MLTAILGGIGAALCFTCSSICASSSSRKIGPGSTLSWVMSLGLVLIIVPLAVFGNTHGFTAKTGLYLAISGITNVVGLRIQYVCYRRAPVGIVAAIASTEGVIAAVIATFFGERMPGATVWLLLLITGGVVLAAATRDQPEAGSEFKGKIKLDSIGLLVVVALLFGVCLFTTAKAGNSLSLVWVLVPARLCGTLMFTVPLVATKKLVVTRKTFWLGLAAGTAEVTGILSYAFGARTNIAIAAVLSAQFAALTPIVAFVLFKERLHKHQVLGICLVLIGVAIVSVLEA